MTEPQSKYAEKRGEDGHTDGREGPAQNVEDEQQKPNPAEVYHEYLVPGIHARWAPLFLAHADPKAGERVVDVACGTGVVTRHVAPMVGGNGRVVGVDVSSDMLEVARTLPAPEGAAVEWVECDVHELDLADGAFDLALCQQAFQFFENRVQAAREIRRALTPDGRAVVSVWRDLAHHPIYEALLTSEARYLDEPVEDLATPFMMGEAGELRSTLDDAGFRRVDIVQESHEVRFPSPERFVELTLLAAASIIPPSEMDREARGEMISSIGREIQPTLQEYVQRDEVVFPMHANMALAYAS